MGQASRVIEELQTTVQQEIDPEALKQRQTPILLQGLKTFDLEREGEFKIGPRRLPST